MAKYRPNFFLKVWINDLPASVEGIPDPLFRSRVCLSWKGRIRVLFGRPLVFCVRARDKEVGDAVMRALVIEELSGEVAAQ